MKALVTGGAGFIGSHLAEALCRRGARVVIVDDLSYGSLDNLAWRRPGDPVEFIQGDIANEEVIARALPGCDWVFHQAAVASVPLSVAQPVETNRTNLTATLGLLAAANAAGVKRFVFASSSAIYGDSPAPRKRETDPPQPLSPYALQKYASERYAQLFHAAHGLETVSLRYFNVFGPRQSFNSPYSGVIARFCTAALAGQPVTIFGDGHQTRDFVYVDNVVAANLLVSEAPAAAVAGRYFNIAGGESISLRQLVEELARQTGSNPAPRFEPARPGDVRHSSADLTAARAIGFDPKVTWQEGLARTLEFYRRGS
ncbi:MAG: NAD-dependent epimerase/dehydratase family protein [Verrucomicrobia bacterium]|nr:NAD-dependent epimerase/dehydratase family protein [Verrucomicrobiota bacterium]